MGPVHFIATSLASKSTSRISVAFYKQITPVKWRNEAWIPLTSSNSCALGSWRLCVKVLLEGNLSVINTRQTFFVTLQHPKNVTVLGAVGPVIKIGPVGSDVH